MKPFLFFLLLAFTGLNFNAQNTFVPDDNFEQALIDKGLDFGVPDDYVPTANINTVTFLSIKNKAISDLTGIEDFIALKTLDVSINNLTNIDVSYNIDLTNLYCNSNSLTSLDVSNNLSLTHLHCFDNSLITLDLRNNVLLRVLYTYVNNLTRLNLSKNPFLESINCSTNQLIGINLKNGKNTRIMHFLASNNPDLSCIQVDDPDYSRANWIYFSPSMMFSENCRYSRYTQDSYDLENQIFDNNVFSIYPNPVNDVMFITLETDANYTIYNSNGQLLLEGKLIKGERNLNVSQLQSGMYVLNILKDGISTHKKFFKK